jgi:hypothetical protein
MAGPNANTSASAFQERRRERRRQQILLLLAGIRDEFQGLLVAIGGQLQGLADLADRLRSVERAVTLAKRYGQLAGEARLLGLEPPPALEVPATMVDAYVLLVGRRPPLYGGRAKAAP